MIERIQLPRGEWYFDPKCPIGKAGGFGAVFAGHSENYGELAVKKLHLQAGDAAHREMRIANELADRNLQHIIPVFDAGEDPNTGAYFVVMPRAEQSLQDAIKAEENFTDLETAETLLEILQGLSELPDIVHRDLKPANVLLHVGSWKVADFGIARFVEEATSARTLKDCLSPLYAAPEQWQYLRATGATDIYALGCIGYALLTGKPPFEASTTDELHAKHLKADPPKLQGVMPQLEGLLTMMLRKPPESRPSRERARQILTAIIERGRESTLTSSAYGELAAAGAEVARAVATAERLDAESRSEYDKRREFGESGRKILQGVVQELFARIMAEAPMAKVDPGAKGPLKVNLGRGTLEVSIGDRASAYSPGGNIRREDSFPHSKWDVVVGESIQIRQSQPEYNWSASLWYCKLPGIEQYRWYEAAYFQGMVRNPPRFAPFDLKDKLRDADYAAAPGMHTYQLAWGPHPIDDENIDEFCERWIALLAKAAQGQMGYPRSLPLSREFWKN